jgi:hypothetical protein
MASDKVNQLLPHFGFYGMAICGRRGDRGIAQIRRGVDPAGVVASQDVDEIRKAPQVRRTSDPTVCINGCMYSVDMLTNIVGFPCVQVVCT